MHLTKNINHNYLYTHLADTASKRESLGYPVLLNTLKREEYLVKNREEYDKRLTVDLARIEATEGVSLKLSKYQFSKGKKTWTFHGHVLHHKENPTRSQHLWRSRPPTNISELRQLMNQFGKFSSCLANLM